MAESDGREEELRRLREEYREARDAFRNVLSADSAGEDAEVLNVRCREAKAALKRALWPGESLLGGPAQPQKVTDGFRARMPIDPKELVSMPSPLPAALRKQRTFSYDTTRFPFGKLVAEILNVSESQLCYLHRACPDGEVVEEASYVDGAKWMGHWHRSAGSPTRQRFSELLHDFVTNFCVPRMHEDFPLDAEHGNSVDSVQHLQPAIAYQREPTFRTQVPDKVPMGFLHADSDYHHPPAEVNWWLPLTPVWGANTLHIESEPGKGDFTPAQLDYGQVLRFYGNLCQHHTVANTTERTRVSFDLRVLSLRHHDEDWKDRRGMQCMFEIGSYYRLAGQSGSLARDAAR